MCQQLEAQLPREHSGSTHESTAPLCAAQGTGVTLPVSVCTGEGACPAQSPATSKGRAVHPLSSLCPWAASQRIELLALLVT